MELSPLEQLDDTFLRLVSRVIWRRPERRILKMFDFSFTEEDSFRDMARAAELTSTPELRGKYMLHALDEARHADLFRQRSSRLMNALEHPQQRDAVALAMQARLQGAISLHESYHHNTLFEELGELEFLAFVYVAERRGAQQFRIYRELLQSDPESQVMFNRIMTEEKFHMSYSRQALDKLAQQGRSSEVRWALLRVRARRYWQAWLRFCRKFANVSNGFLFTTIYLLVLAPTAFLTRPRLPAGGWMNPEDTEVPSLETASQQF